jgi:hypothetical protein
MSSVVWPSQRGKVGKIQMFTSVIPTTPEAEIWRIVVQGQLRQKVIECISPH